MKRLRYTVLGVASLFALLASKNSLGEYGLNLTEGVTPIANQVYDLHMLILYICCAIAVVVFGTMFWSIFHHRKSKGAVAAQFHESTTVEIIWTVIPFLILVGMAIPATKTLLAMEDTSDPEMTIKVTGYQWKWGYEYLDEDVRFMSSLSEESNKARQLNADVDLSKVDNYLLDVDNPLVIPTNTRIRFVITAADVIHAWWVPALGWKKDAIPGFINEAWTYVEQPGTYRGQCAELCGKDHGFMPVVVKAVPPEEYRQWLVGQKASLLAAAESADRAWTQKELLAKGQTIYNAQCAACHQADGKGLPGVFPAISGSAVATGPLEQHRDVVMNGRSGTAMAAYRDQLSDVELAAVLTYQRNALGNQVGDVVQPKDIKASR